MEQITLEKVLGVIESIRTEVRGMEEGYSNEPRLLYLRTQISVCRDHLSDFSREIRYQKELNDKAPDTYVEKRIVQLYEEDPVKWKTVSRAEAQAKSEQEYSDIIDKKAHAIADNSFLDKKIDSAKSIENSIAALISSINSDKRYLG